MRPSLTHVALLLLCLSLACAVPQLLARKKDQSVDVASNEQKRAVHALNRLTFGPRPGDVQQVVAMGVDRWIDLQLHPEKITDKDVDAHLAFLHTLRMSTKEILEDFPDGQMVKQVADGKHAMPSDPARRAVYQVQVARLDEKQERKERKAAVQPPAPAEPAAAEGAKTAEELAAAAAASADSAAPDTNAMNAMTTNVGKNDMSSNATAEAEVVKPNPSPADAAAARRREDRLYADLKVQGLIDLPPNERYKKVLAMSADEQIAFADTLTRGKGQDFLEGLDPRQKEVLQAMNNPPAVVVEELSQAKLLRAVYSERQLEEVMTDFWFNHFNVFIGKGPERLLVTNYEQAVIRPHALGKFEDLLVATAKSPAMQFYLDNWLSVGPNSPQAEGAPRRPAIRYGRYGRPRAPHGPNPGGKKKQNSGLNENYGRELLELHTLSVNGGYSQRDVTEVAKVFTGWTIDKPFEGMSFRYDPYMHEPGPKFVLGHRIKPKGEDEGREVLHMLATSPQTAHFISLKLAQRFVSDDPPPALVDRMAKTFQKKKGDIREVLSTLFHSSEFWADGTYRAKVKTPLEFVASAVRATGASVDDALPLVRQLNNMGMPLYGAQPPTGYSMKADTWVSSAALLNRMNFALALTSGKVRGVKLDAVQLAGGPTPPPDATATLSAMEAKLLEADVSKETHDSIVAQLEMPTKNSDKKGKSPQSKPPDVNTIAGLLLGSPEFQRR
jgi:uncharacterized protein (DUF1800 family)